MHKHTGLSYRAGHDRVHCPQVVICSCSRIAQLLGREGRVLGVEAREAGSYSFGHSVVRDGRRELELGLTRDETSLSAHVIE